MKKKHKKMLIAGLILLALCFGLYQLFGNPMVYINNQKLSLAVSSIESETVSLNDLIPFDWDRAFCPGPYTSREEIAAVIGFDSPSIRDNQNSEGMSHVLFIKGNQVVACVLGHPSSVGYRFSFWEMVTYQDEIQLNVEQGDHWIELCTQEDV